MSDSGRDVGARVRICPDGPLLVSGAAEVVDADGNVVPVERPTVAVCRCDRTGRAPWCDGSHKQQTATRSQQERPG